VDNGSRFFGGGGGHARQVSMEGFWLDGGADRRGQAGADRRGHAQGFHDFGNSYREHGQGFAFNMSL
jgi:hypothetical protein